MLPHLTISSSETCGIIATAIAMTWARGTAAALSEISVMAM